MLIAIAIGGAVAAGLLVTKAKPKANVIYVHPSTTTSTLSPTTTVVGPRQQAAALNQLLAQSANDRVSIDSATSDIQNCGNLSQDQSTLEGAAQSRQTMLNQLSQLDVAQLPNSGSLISALKSAWQSSLQSDNSYAAWASDLLQSGCVAPASTTDSNWQAAQSSDTSASAAKDQFVSEWNVLATTYGLPQYQQNQI